MASGVMSESNPELCILEILELKQQCIPSLSEDVLRRITAIREKCIKAEREEQKEGSGGATPYTWRRGTGTMPSGTIPQPSSSSTNKQKGSYTPVPQWRGQQSIKVHQKQPTTNEKNAGRYVSKFTNTGSPIEDKILNQVILNKLNKFSQANYQEVKGFLQQILDSNEYDFLRDFMMLVFKKAASEPTFCPLYARMIHELSGTYTSLLVELENLYVEYLTIFEEVNETTCKDYEQFVQRNREKLHRLGYSQFLGELMSIGILHQPQILKLYTTIFQQIKLQGAIVEGKQQLLEEYVDCLLRMTRALKKESSESLLTIRKGLGSVCEPIIEEILQQRSTQYPGLSKKATFGLMDCLDIFRGT